MLLLSVRRGVVTATLPLVEPGGTLVLISVLDTTVNVAAVSPKVTLVVPVRLFPKTMTSVPASPDVGIVSTNGPSPTDSRNTVPLPLVPPSEVVP